MKRPEFIARQARCPSGLLGRLLGGVMALETASDNERALDLLAPGPSDHVLEIGFGHGRTIARAAMRAKRGCVAGVEISETMLRMAGRYNRRLIDAGRVELKIADAAALPYIAGRFDKVLSVHTLYFWPDLRDTLREIRRVMKPGGGLVLGFRSAENPETRDFPESTYRFYRRGEIEEMLCEAGFTGVRILGVDDDLRGTLFAVAHAARA